MLVVVGAAAAVQLMPCPALVADLCQEGVG